MLQLVGFGVVLPALVAFSVGYLLVRRPFGSQTIVWLAPAFALAVGYVLAHIALYGFRGLFPSDVTHRLPIVALIAVAASSLDGLTATAWRRIGLDLVAAAATAALLLSPLQPSLAAHELLLSGLGLVVVMVATSRASHVLLELQQSVFVPVGLAFVVGIVGMVCAASGTAVVGQLAGAIAAAIFGLAVLRRIRPHTPLAASAREMVSLVVGCLALTFFYAEMNADVLAATAFAVLAPGAFAWSVKRRRRLGSSVGWAASVVALGFAGWRSVDAPASPLPESDQYDYAYE